MVRSRNLSLKQVAKILERNNHLFSHFNQKQLSRGPLKKRCFEDPKHHERRELYWRHTLKTMTPLCLNVNDD